MPKILGGLITDGTVEAGTGFRQGPTGATWTTGTGTPEGAVTAPIGSMFSRTDGSTGTALYRKEIGTGNTGWVATAAAPADAVSSVDGRTGVVTLADKYVDVAGDNMTGNLGLGTPSPTAKLQFAANTIAAGGILFGTDANFYRSAPDTLKTDDTMHVVGQNSLAVKCEQGGNNAFLTGAQVAFAYGSGSGGLYQHRVNSRHSSSQAAENYLDFYMFAPGTDATTALGTKHVMTLRGNGWLGLNGVIAPTAALNLPADTVASGGLLFGTDTSLYRSAVNTLTTSGIMVASVLALGTNPAQSQTLRMPNNNWVAFRNAANTADARVLAVGTDDRVYVGTADIASGLTLRCNASTIQLDNITTRMAEFGSTYMAISSAASSTGSIRLPHPSTIKARNAANTADVTVIEWNNGRFSFGFGDAPVDVVGSTDIKFYVSGMKVAEIGASYLALGINPAQSGLLRMPSAQAMVWRNNANTADGLYITTDSGDSLVYAAPNWHRFYAGGTEMLSIRTTNIVAGGTINVTGGVTTSSVITVGANAATSGWIRLANNAGIVARNAANNADIELLRLDTSNVIQLGGAGVTVNVPGRIQSAGNVEAALSVTTGGFRQGPTGPSWLAGTGTPEGAVTAPIGSLFSRSDGGADTALYRKESGSGNTGWVATATATAGAVSSVDGRTGTVTLSDLYVDVAGDNMTGNLGLGAPAPTAKLQFAAATTAAGGILFGTDANFYRSAPDTLKTDDALLVSTYLAIGATPAASGTLRMVGGIVWRNTANTGDGPYITTDASDSQVYASTNWHRFYAAGSIALDIRATGLFSVMPWTTTGTLQLGTGPAGTGTIRLPQNGTIYGKDLAAADVAMLRMVNDTVTLASGSSPVQIGCNSAYGVAVIVSGVNTFQVNSAGVTLSDNCPIAVGSTNGTKIATAITQKLGFWNATPVVQSTGWAATAGYTADKALNPATTTLAEVANVLGTLIDTLKTYGLLGA